ncbi:GGDEF domain-containing protein [Aliirhizobium smilacinae]|nr:GGDEF domain-containing protein [Rhizobium smilacinae]
MEELARKDDQQSNLLAMQMEALYRGAPASAMSIFGGVLTILTYWSPSLAPMLTIWFGCICVIAITHLSSAAMRPEFMLQRRFKLDWSPAAWSRLIRAVYLSSGTCWGLGGSWLLLQGDDHQTLVMCCIAMGAVTVTYPAVVYRPVFNLFQVPIFLAFSIAFMISDIEYGNLLAVASATLCAALAIIARSMGEQLSMAFRLLDRNRQLTEQLAARRLILEEENRELTAQTLTDPLTGLANRRRLIEFLRRTPDRCAVLVVDIDHFKSYNDTYGHSEGDICLILVADALRRSIDASVDLVARHGGEEFVVVLTELDRDQALEVAEKIRTNIQSVAGLHPQRIRRLVTASIGLAHREEERQKSSSELLVEADSALYAAKNAGRNRVETLSDTHPAAAE